MCCKVIGVPVIGKPRGQWCKHCDADKGCAVYQARPDACRIYSCRFLVDPELDETWRPCQSGLVINLDRRRVVVNVDPDRPDAWRAEPFYSTFKRWSRATLPGWAVFISIGDDVIAVYPDRDVPVQTHVPAA